MNTKSIMVQGTTSFSGKTFLVMALCRIFADMGVKVAPFKSQNMSLNSFVTKEGREISRAQALQALAAGIEPTSDMNPILIKPKGDSKSQIMVNGKPYKDIEAREYYDEFAMKEGLRIVKEAYDRLKKQYDLIVIEGAGSPAEINLYEKDIANMRVAELTGSPVILVADIDRGGVFASIYGTINLLKKEDKERLKGVVINKFRGDIEILKPGITMIEEKVGKPVLGVIPYIGDLRLPDEDSLGLERHKLNGSGSADIAVIRLPRISNFTDFDPLIHDGVNVRYVGRTEELGSPDAIIIPGTKNTLEDLLWLKTRGFDRLIKEMSKNTPVIGICGGYQMLGKRIIDNGIEGDHKVVEGLGLLDVETRFTQYKKTTKQVFGTIVLNNGIFEGVSGIKVSGYEIHMGNTTLGENANPVLDIDGRKEGAVDSRGFVFGTYFHGIFDTSEFRKLLIKNLDKKTKRSGAAYGKNIDKIWMEDIGKASKVVSDSIDIEELI
ncbi:MAG: cobyric acid synthase, partial [Candidatus Hydrothermarchaeales archaeon]